MFSVVQYVSVYLLRRSHYVTNQVISRLVHRGEHDFITSLLYYFSAAVFQYALAARYLLRVTYFHVIFVFISLLVIILRDFFYFYLRDAC